MCSTIGCDNITKPPHVMCVYCWHALPERLRRMYQRVLSRSYSTLTEAANIRFDAVNYSRPKTKAPPKEGK